VQPGASRAFWVALKAHLSSHVVAFPAARRRQVDAARRTWTSFGIASASAPHAGSTCWTATPYQTSPWQSSCTHLTQRPQPQISARPRAASLPQLLKVVPANPLFSLPTCMCPCVSSSVIICPCLSASVLICLGLSLDPSRSFSTRLLRDIPEHSRSFLAHSAACFQKLPETSTHFRASVSRCFSILLEPSTAFRQGASKSCCACCDFPGGLYKRPVALDGNLSILLFSAILPNGLLLVV
jgi:hypothetical protein